MIELLEVILRIYFYFFLTNILFSKEIILTRFDGFSLLNSGTVIEREDIILLLNSTIPS